MTTLDLTRSVSFTVTRAAEEEAGDGLTLEGYAAVFGQWTEIDSWEGMFREQFKRGAFRKTLRERAVLMQYDHGRHPLIGSIPVGTYDRLTEEDAGLHVVGRLSDNWLIEPVRDAIRDGGVTGMSIRFSVVRDEWRDNKGKLVKPEELMELLWMPGERGPLERTVTEAKLVEAGPVAWPAYEGTSVGVRARSAAADLLSDEDRRRTLRQALVASSPAVPDIDAMPDEERRELALALLTIEDPDHERAPERRRAVEAEVPAAPPSGHPAPDAPAAADDVTRTTGAPPVEAPAVTTTTPDAPPAAGHPSQTERERREQIARQLQVTLSGVRK
jgi:HK97 family phage prohead protease